MKGDSVIVLALMLGFLYMVAQGVWVRLEDETRSAIYRNRGQLLAGVGAAVCAVVLLMTV